MSMNNGVGLLFINKLMLIDNDHSKLYSLNYFSIEKIISLLDMSLELRMKSIKYDV